MIGAGQVRAASSAVGRGDGERLTREINAHGGASSEAADYKPGEKSAEATFRTAERTTTCNVPTSSCRALGARNETHAPRVIKVW